MSHKSFPIYPSNSMEGTVGKHTMIRYWTCPESNHAMPNQALRQRLPHRSGSTTEYFVFATSLTQRTIMKQINCAGTPYEIGFQHGQATKTEIGRGLNFYADLFSEKAGLSWSQACDVAAKFDTLLQNDWPAYREEIQGKQMRVTSQDRCLPQSILLGFRASLKQIYGMSHLDTHCSYWPFKRYLGC